MGIARAFDIRVIVKQVLSEVDESADLDNLVSMVMNRIPQDLSRCALQQTITPFVQLIIGQGRLLTAKSENGQLTTEPSVTHNRSAKVEAIQNRWARQLDSLYAVPSEDGSRIVKRLGSMSWEELIAAAGARRQQAEKNMAKADYLERIADAVLNQGVSCADELVESPEPVAA